MGKLRFGGCVCTLSPRYDATGLLSGLVLSIFKSLSLQERLLRRNRHLIPVTVIVRLVNLLENFDSI